jgi:diguanylate cyclase (GGDEF)-like protein
VDVAFDSNEWPGVSERRWRRLLVVRLGLAALAAVGLLAVSREAGPAVIADPEPPAMLIVGYVVLVVTIEIVRRRGRRRGRGLVTPVVLLDGAVLAVVVAAAGGTAGPLEFIVVLHVAAAALIVSARTGLVVAIWHATLLLVIVPSPGPLAVTTHVAGYLTAGAAVALFAAVEGRAARRQRDRMAGQLQLLARLEPVVTAEDGCAALAGHVVRAGFRRGAVLVVGADGVVGATASATEGPVLVAAARSPELSATDREPVLDRFLDPVADPLLDRLLPGAMNLVRVPIVVDGASPGVVVGEWRPGRRARIPEAVVDGLRRDAAHFGLALRAVLLLEQVERRSRRDLLSGLLNRRGFDDALDRELSRVERSAAPMSLVLIDLDHFKAVNDTRGHQAGDRVLAAVGGVLLDAAGTHDAAARIGGDEFALLLPDCGPTAAQVVADRVLATVAATVGRHGVTASAGVATAPRQGRTRGALIQAADEALYAAKAAGRNRSVGSNRRVGPAEPILVLDHGGRRRPHRRSDLRSRVAHPAGPVG